MLKPLIQNNPQIVSAELHGVNAIGPLSPRAGRGGGGMHTCLKMCDMKSSLSVCSSCKLCWMATTASCACKFDCSVPLHPPPWECRSRMMECALLLADAVKVRALVTTSEHQQGPPFSTPALAKARHIPQQGGWKGWHNETYTQHLIGAEMPSTCCLRRNGTKQARHCRQQHSLADFIVERSGRRRTCR